MNDDFFIMKPTDLKYFNRGTLEDHIAIRRFDMYQVALRATQRYLKAEGLPTLSYEVHVPMVFSKRKLKPILHMILNQDKPLQYRSIYGNMHVKNSEYMEDCKNPANYLYKTFLSSSERSFITGFGAYIRSKL